VAGELPYSEGSGNVYDLTLDESQLRLIRAAQATGKPVVVVMVAGRPRVVREVYPATRAFLWAGLPGFEGATAIAEVISGAVNPSGKLSFSYPNYPGMYYTYDHKYHDLDIFRNFTDNKTMMAFFGDGLSYTTFRYDELKISATEFSGNQSLKVSVKVTNTGSRAGKEAVLWYLTDEYASVTRPVKQLKHFEKQELAPGQSRVFEFEITPQHLSFPVADGSRKLEDGYFRVSVGGQEARFQYRK
jgi:beta-glucosidase